MKKVYLAGPMTGLPDFNYPAFNEAAALLRGLGFDVVNPAENGLPSDAPWTAHMKEDIKRLVDCDGIVLMPGYENSQGARMELYIANRLGLEELELEAALMFGCVAEAL